MLLVTSDNLQSPPTNLKIYYWSRPIISTIFDPKSSLLYDKSDNNATSSQQELSRRRILSDVTNNVNLKAQFFSRRFGKLADAVYTIGESQEFNLGDIMGTWGPSGWAEYALQKQQERKDARFGAYVMLASIVGSIVFIALYVYYCGGD